MATKKKLLWKFLRMRRGKIASDYVPGWGEVHVWQVGKTYSLECEIYPIRTCRYGFHSSPSIAAARNYVDGRVLALVEAWGEEDYDDSRNPKYAHQHMRIKRAWLCPLAKDRKDACAADECGTTLGMVRKLNKILKPIK